MTIRSNGFYNNEAFANAAANLAGLFQPPSGAEVANYALADERRAKMNQLAWLFDNPDDPTASKRSALTGVQGYGQTPDGFTYNVDRGYQASTENNIRDNARAIAERQMIEDATTQRLGIPDVNARYRVDSEAAVSRGNNLRDNQTKTITEMLNPLDPGQIRPEVSEEVMKLLDMPAIGPASGTAKLPSETEWQAAQNQRLVDSGKLTDTDLVDIIMGERQPVQALGADGKPVYLSPGAAVRERAQPLQKEQTPGLSVTLPDGTVVQQGGKALTEGQSKDSVYFTRASGAIPKLDQYGDALTEITGKIGSATEKAGGNFIKSKEYQLAEQAGLEFLQAVLRKDTGAAITPAEQTEYGRVYLPQPGDSTELLAQKKASRARALAAIRLGLPPDAIINAERAGVDLSASVLPTERNTPAADTAEPVYATNPQTGERLVLRNGAWEPVQ
ncbi:hypothetical protein Q9314_15220 [Shinella sumterensis]|nr:hypothetical protein Q9314_15220 [Shinella sumterensis]